MEPLKGAKVPESFEARQAATEARVEGLHSDVQEIIATVRGGFRDLQDEMKGLHGRITDSQKPNWTVPLGIGSLALSAIIAFTSMVFMFYGRDVSRIEKTAEQTASQNTETRVEAAELKGRNDVTVNWLRTDIERLMTKFESVTGATQGSIKALDDALQREMRDVNAVTDTKVLNADSKIQGEISRNAEERRGQFTSLKEALDALSTLQRDAATIHADHGARLKAIEESKPK